MSSYWCTFAGGALIAAPIAWAVGRFGFDGFIDRLLDVLAGGDAFVDESARRHPAGHTPRSHVRRLEPEKRR